MIKLVEKNKRLLMLYRTSLRALGWILLCMGGIGIALLVLEYSQTGGRITLGGTLGMLKRSGFIFINIALVSLGLAQLVRYLCGNGCKMGLLLRYGEKIFYVYAIITILQVGGQVWHVAAGRMGANISLNLHWLLVFLPTLLYQSTKALILVGLGQLLKQLIAAIEDSKLKISQRPPASIREI